MNQAKLTFALYLILGLYFVFSLTACGDSKFGSIGIGTLSSSEQYLPVAEDQELIQDEEDPNENREPQMSGRNTITDSEERSRDDSQGEEEDNPQQEEAEPEIPQLNEFELLGATAVQPEPVHCRCWWPTGASAIVNWAYSKNQCLAYGQVLNNNNFGQTIYCDADDSRIYLENAPMSVGIHQAMACVARVNDAYDFHPGRAMTVAGCLDYCQNQPYENVKCLIYDEEVWNNESGLNEDSRWLSDKYYSR